MEQSALPLALMPDVQIIMRAAEQQHRARPGAPPPSPDVGLPPPAADRPLPVSIADGEMLRRQFYFAVAVHERAAQVRLAMSCGRLKTNRTAIVTASVCLLSLGVLADVKTLTLHKPIRASRLPVIFDV